jgi:hypothetical protein
MSAIAEFFSLEGRARRRHRRRARRLAKLLGNTAADYLLTFPVEMLERIEGQAAVKNNKARLEDLVPLGELYVNPGLTKAYRGWYDRESGLRRFRRLRKVRLKPITLRFAPDAAAKL